MHLRRVTLAYSPCPNDTYVFGALAQGRVHATNLAFDIDLMDIDALNRSAQAGRYDVIKVSCNTGFNLPDYSLLDAGAALGFACGPMLLSRKPRTVADLSGCRVAFPGEQTTAFLLYRLLGLPDQQHFFIPYDQIVNRVAAGEFDCGVIIHESRFTFSDAGLHKVIDFGSWWELETGLPLPLGCVMIRRSLGQELKATVESLIRKSLLDAQSRDHPVDEYVRVHAQEMDEQVVRSHIQLYVNRFTRSLGEVGYRALARLQAMAADQGVAEAVI